jgi:hypothetical protein
MEEIMRMLIAGCIVALIASLGAAVVLNAFVQQSSSVAFTKPGVRIS